MKRQSRNGPTVAGLQGAAVVLAAGLLAISGGRLAAEEPEEPEEVEHLDQRELIKLVKQGMTHEAFELAFEHGDEMFETIFVAPDGVGANIGNGARFTRVPRADLAGPGQWATHTPARITGPNAAACNGCHNKPANDGAGGIEVNVVRDPLMTGNVADYIERNTPHVFGAGAIQRLAEEMTAELRATRAWAGEAACASGRPQSMRLQAKGVHFGTITARPSEAHPCTPSFDESGIEGVAADLVIRPFRWKGADVMLRAFVREAANNELGMQAVELVGRGVDGDHDGVVNELSVGDVSALEIYVAAQPRPVTEVELAEHGLAEPLPPEQIEAIEQGEVLFAKVGCDQCHRPTLTVQDPVFHVPSPSPLYRDAIFPSGLEPRKEGVDPIQAVSYDMTRDLPDNLVEKPDGGEIHLGVFAPDPQGRAAIPLYADLKRHEMGPELADAIDEIGTGPSVWLTRPLWGIGSTDPYLHDGRATTLDEAIRLHGGEAAPVRAAYVALGEGERAQLIAFLQNMVLFRDEEDEEEAEGQLEEEEVEVSE
jgi:Di-haem oxidoreductase, putative peroxidase